MNAQSCTVYAQDHLFARERWHTAWSCMRVMCAWTGACWHALSTDWRIMLPAIREHHSIMAIACPVCRCVLCSRAPLSSQWQAIASCAVLSRSVSARVPAPTTF